VKDDQLYLHHMLERCHQNAGGKMEGLSSLASTRAGGD
jgi:hypothetical protein